nr:transposase, mutator type [Tanacetum cinerariifolium]
MYEECDLEDFDSDIDPNDDEAERKKDLRNISLDKCFMSGPFPMQILTTVGVDPNNDIYHFAYAVVESEKKQSWLWFLDCLGDDLELFRNSNFTFVTDRQKRIIPTLAETFPAAEHRYCLKHIYDNMKLQWRGKLFKELLWRSSTAITDLTGMPCKHAVVAIWNMAENGLEPGIPETWVHQSYWLKTWEEMYMFKINPCNGPDLWPLLDSPIIFTPRDYHTPIGRPLKKRKKSVAELPMPNQGDLQSTQIPSQGIVNPSTPIVNVNPSAKQNMSHSALHVTDNPSTQSNVTHSAPVVRFPKATASRLSPAKKTNSSGKRKWSERFMNYLEEQTDGEAMINSIKNGDQPLPRVTQVSIAGSSSTEQPPLKDKSMCNKPAKDLWDALARHMLGYEYGEQDRKAAVLYEYETLKATEGELLLDTYIRYLQVINDLKKCGYSKDNCDLNFKFFNNLQQEWKQNATMMRQNKNLMDLNIDVLYNILKKKQGDVNDAMGLKKKTVVVTSDPLALIAEKTKVSKRKEKVVVSSDSKGSDADDFSELKKITALLAKAFNRRKFYSKPTNNNLRTSSASQSANKKQENKEGHFTKDCKKAKVKDYGYYKTKMLLAKKDKDEQVLFAEDHAWMESSNDSDQEINANMVFMAQIEKVLSDSEASSSSADDKIFEESYYLSESESESEYETSEYYDNTTTYGLFVNDNDDQENFHDCENFLENLIESQIDHNESAFDHNDF